MCILKVAAAFLGLKRELQLRTIRARARRRLCKVATGLGLRHFCYIPAASSYILRHRAAFGRMCARARVFFGAGSLWSGRVELRHFQSATRARVGVVSCRYGRDHRCAPPGAGGSRFDAPASSSFTGSGLIPRLSAAIARSHRTYDLEKALRTAPDGSISRGSA